MKNTVDNLKKLVDDAVKGIDLKLATTKNEVERDRLGYIKSSYISIRLELDFGCGSGSSLRAWAEIGRSARVLHIKYVDEDLFEIIEVPRNLDAIEMVAYVLRNRKSPDVEVEQIQDETFSILAKRYKIRYSQATHVLAPTAENAKQRIRDQLDPDKTHYIEDVS